MIRILGISALILFAPAVASAELWGYNSPLHHALWPEHEERLVVAGQIVSVPEKREFRFRVDDVILGAPSFQGSTINISRSILWPEQLVAYEKGANCVLVLGSKKERINGAYGLSAVVAGRARSYPEASDTLAAREILAGELLGQLNAEKSGARQRALLLQLAPILASEHAQSIQRFVENPDVWVRRSALAALVYATEDPKYLKLAAEDIQVFMNESACKETVEVPGAHWPVLKPQRAMFEDYFFLNPRTWTWGSVWNEAEGEKHLRILDAMLKCKVIDSPSQALLFGDLPSRNESGAFQIRGK
jgi:hypothetical protein